MRVPYLSRRGFLGPTAAALAGLSFAALAHAQHSQASNFTILLRATPVGSEQVTVEHTAEGWKIGSSGRLGPPLDLVLRSMDLRYDADWKPLELTVDATVRGQASVLRTTVSGTTARNTITPFGAGPIEQTDEIDSHAVLIPNPLAAAYEPLAARLRTAAAGSTIAVYQPGQGSFPVEVGESTTEQVKTVERIIAARRTRATFRPPNAPPIGLEIWGDENGRLLRVSVPAQGLEIAREDIASVSTRLVTLSRPNDEDVRIPANGFSLAGTLSKPANATGPLPAVLLIGGSGAIDRDETVFGIPIFGQLANAIADAGFVVLRYDKRGVGQSGGRPESATLADYAEDARAALKMLSERKDVDRRRQAAIGHSEGGWVAMLAGARDDRISALGLVATAGVSGRDLNLYQVTHAAERSNRPEADRQATIDLQKQIQDAVVTGKGWDKIQVSDRVRRQAETPYFQSFLNFDPARVMKDLDQPLLIVHGELDTQIPPANADRLDMLAKSRKRTAPLEVAKLPGINHLLVEATTGEVDEYANLPGRTVSPAVTGAVVAWLRKTFDKAR